MNAKYSRAIANKEVTSKINTINFFIPQENNMSKIVLVRIKNPKLEGSAYWFDSGIEVGVGADLGFTNGDYLYDGATKYIGIDLLLPSNLQIKYNHPTSTLHKRLIKWIDKKFKNKKEYKGCTLMYEVPTTVFIRENDAFYVDDDGSVKNYTDENAIDTDIKVEGNTNSTNSTYNDGSDTNNNMSILLAAGILALKLLK